MLLGTNVLAVCPFFSLGVRQWVWVAGIVGSWIWVIKDGKGKTRSPGSVSLKMPLLQSKVLWSIVALLAILMRVLRFFITKSWPNFDEVETAQAAIQLSHHWEWKIFYGIGQAPALYVWIEGLFFKISSHYFFNLYFPSAALSLVTVIVGYLATRFFFSKTTALLATLFLALSYWPTFTGNFCFLGILLLPFWESVAFILLGVFFKAPSKTRLFWGAVLGLWTGFGFWTYLAWPVVMVVVVLAVFFSSDNQETHQSRKARIAFTAALLLAFLPFGLAIFHEDLFHHLLGFSVFNPWFSIQQRLFMALDYLNSLFWGFWSERTLYVPVGGGLLNPLLASFFFMGLRQLWIRKPSRFKSWMILSSLLFLMPGFLSQNLQVLRINQFSLLIFVFAAWGLEEFLAFFTLERTRAAAMVLILMITIFWDGSRLVQGFKEDEARGQGFRVAFQALCQIASDAGPGYIWLEFGSEPVDADPEIQGLEAASDSFNVVENPKEDHQPVRWAAVITNFHFQPFLQRRFPSYHWRRLVGNESRWDGGLVLGWTNLDLSQSVDLRVIGNWTRAHNWFHHISLEMNDIYNARTHEKTLHDFLRPDPVILEDRFLAACYWEKLSDFYYLYGFDKNFSLVTQNLQKAIEEGYPAAHLYYKLGSLFLRKHRYSEAREAFQKAFASPDNQTPARQALELLSRLESKGAGMGSEDWHQRVASQ